MFLFLVTVISTEFIDSRDDSSKTWLTVCFSDHSCSQLLITKKELTDLVKRGNIKNVMNQIIEKKENE